MRRIICILLTTCLLCTLTSCGPFKQESITENIEESTDAEALAQEGISLVHAGSYEDAFPLLSRASELGDPSAQQTLGWCYFYGYGVDINEEEAFRLFKLAADQGYVLSQYSVGYSYFFGSGVEQNYDEAVKYFNLAADQDLVDAWVALGKCYYYGYGVEKDFEKAAQLYQKAQDGGYEPDDSDQEIIDEVLGENKK